MITRRTAGLAIALVFLSSGFVTLTGAAPAAATSLYASQILADSPSLYWRLGEGVGATTITDSSTHNVASTLTGSPTFGVTGALLGDSDTAATMNGAYAYTNITYGHPNVFTVEAWFKTTTTQGGALISFCDNSGNLDRSIWMDNTGKLVFGVFPSVAKTITSPSSYNNGNWHMATATLSSAGMFLYVDGRQVAKDATTTTAEAATERWRVGAGSSVLSGFPDHPTNLGLVGQEDEAAVWEYTALTSTQILNEYATSAYGATTTASVTIDPSFTFAVNGQAAGTNCNGLPAATIATTANTVGLGRVDASAPVFGVQQLQVSANAGDGYLVYIRSTATTSPVLKGSGTDSISDSGTEAVPVAGTEFFGYSTDSTTAALSSASLVSVPLNTGNDIVGNGVAGQNQVNCVAFGLGVSPLTPADTYLATVIYTAVPAF